MKLAEALSLRKDIQTRIEQLGNRLRNNVKVQEGDEPAEDPNEIMGQIDALYTQLEDLIARINATNMSTVVRGRTLTRMMAEREVLTGRIGVLRGAFDSAAASQDRYSRSEIKMVTTIDVKKLGRQIDELSRKRRELDVEIQATNFNTELI